MGRANWLRIVGGGLIVFVSACEPKTTSDDRSDSDDTEDETSSDEDAQNDEASSDDDGTSSSRTPDSGPRRDASNPPTQMLIDAGKDAAADGSRTDARTNAPSSDSGSARSDAGTTTADSSRPPNPTTGTFPAVEDVGADGPFAARTVNNTGPGGGFTLYHPEELAPDGALNPIVAWGNGGFTTPDAYPMLPHLASHGFVVIASNNPFVGGADMRSGIEWVVEQNEDSSSDFYQKLDVDNIAGMGYSLGGLATYEIAADPRVVTIIIVSGGNVTDDRSLVATLHTPTAYFCTDDDASEGNCAGDYEAATVPTFFGVMNGSEHTDVADIFALGVQQIMDRMKLATTAWLRWQQMGDESLRAMFVGADCGLCEDPGWTVHPQKNGLM